MMYRTIVDYTTLTMSYIDTCIKLKQEEPQRQYNVTTEEYIQYDDIFIKFKYLENLTAYFRGVCKYIQKKYKL